MLSHDELVGLFPLKYLKETDDSGNPKYIFRPEEPVFANTLQKVLEEVFKDFNFRTLTKNVSDSDLKQVLSKTKNQGKMTVFLVNKLGTYKTDANKTYFEKVIDYLSGGLENTGFSDFDTFHHDLCKTFLEAIKYFDEGHTIELYTDIHYGKAQKIVNMMFKHLYCLKGAEEHEELFADCHMALDSFTLEWFERQHSEYCHGNNYHKQIWYKNGYESKKQHEWSNLEYSEDDEIKGHYSYMYYVRKIRKMCSSPFKEEFIIWPRIQQELATEAFILAMPADEETKTSIKDTYGMQPISDQTFAKARKIRLLSMDLDKKIEEALKLTLKYVDTTQISLSDETKQLLRQCARCADELK